MDQEERGRFGPGRSWAELEGRSCLGLLTHTNRHPSVQDSADNCWLMRREIKKQTGGEQDGKKDKTSWKEQQKDDNKKREGAASANVVWGSYL